MKTRSILKKTLLGILAIGGLLVVVWVNLQSLNSRLDRCAFGLRQTAEFSWRIAQTSNMDAQVIWERSIRHHDARIAASHDLLIYPHGFTGCPDDGKLFGIATSDGTDRWAIDLAYLNSISGLSYYADSFFVLTCCTDVTRLDAQGNKLWTSSAIPLRAVRPSIYMSSNELYIPTLTSVERFSIVDGSTQTPIEGAKSLGIFEGIVLFNPSGRFLEVRSQVSNDLLWTTVLPSDNTLSNFNTFLSSNTLILSHWGGGQLIAYDKESGEVLWTIEDDFWAPPIMVDNLILTYDKEQNLIFRDIDSGTVRGSIEIFHTGQPVATNNLTFPPVIAANGDTLFVWSNLTSDLVAISYEFLYGVSS